MNNKMRVRFAPSPTGHLHIGGLRVAIFNWLFAKHNNGKFLIRIEDTDLERSRKEYTDSILQSFNWMQMQPDEDIVIQSERFAEHKILINKLLEQEKAYRCFCPAKSTEQLENPDSYSKYDGKCRNLVPTTDDLNQSFVVRFKLPNENVILSSTFEIKDPTTKLIVFNDLIHGNIAIALDQFDDFIIARSDGTPVYNFVVVADDNYMRISHVIRGEDHISNTPKQIFLYRALGFEVPLFAHVPLILNEQGQKLSKRDASVSVLEYKNQGFLADALFNYLVRLGWSHGDQEIFSKEELIRIFSLEAVGKKGSIFDIQKLEWFNTIYLKQKSAQEILQIILKDIQPNFLEQSAFAEKQILQLIDLYKDRVKTLSELATEITKLNSPEVSITGFANANTKNYLEQIIIELQSVQDWSETVISMLVKDFCNKNGLKLPEIAIPVRMALTGSNNSPGIFDLLAIFGKDKSIKRLEKLKKIF